MRVTGTTPVGETLIAGAALGRRLFGWRRFSGLAYFGVLGILGATWITLPEATGLNGGLAVLGLAVSVVFVAYGYIRWRRNLGQKGWARMGALPQVELCYDVDAAGLRIESSSGVVTALPWSALLGICREKTLWLLISMGGATFYLPRRFFVSADDEKVLIAFCLDHMSPDARARSPEATAFLVQS